MRRLIALAVMVTSATIFLSGIFSPMGEYDKWTLLIFGWAFFFLGQYLKLRWKL